MNEIRVVGLQRSGSHAVIQWIVENCTGDVLALDGIRARGNPYGAPRGELVPQPQKVQRDPQMDEQTEVLRSIGMAVGAAAARTEAVLAAPH